MRKNPTKHILAILLSSISSWTYAQQWLGRTTGNYSGTYGVYNNASSISDSKYKYYFSLWGRGNNFYNNFLTYNAPIKLNHWANNRYDAQYQNSMGKVDMQKDWLTENLDGKDKQFSFTQDIWGPAFMFPLSRQWNMSINTRQRSGLQMYGISENVARMLHNGLDSSGGIYSGSNPLSRNTSYHNNAFGANMQSFQEISMTIGGVISKSEHHQFNFGATIKFLRGLGSSYIKGDNFNISATGNTSASINGNLEYAYTDQKSVVAPFNRPYGLFSLQSKGAGGGFDIGFNYTYSSKRLKYPTSCEMNARKSDYDFKLAMALNDLGGIHWGSGNIYAYNSPISTNVNAPRSILDPFGARNQNGFDTIGQKIFGQTAGSSSSQGFSTSLPLAFNLQADFRLSRHIYTSIYWNQNLKTANSAGLRTTSMLSVIPRIESRVFDLSIPLTLSENYKNFYVGAYVRVGPVFFGSDNLGGLLKVSDNSGFKGADIYGGVSFGIGHCHKWWYNDVVDQVYMDSLRHDTVKMVEKDTIIKHDTLKIVKKDTVYFNKKTKEMVKHDTVYINKTIKPKADERDKEILVLRKQLEDLNKQKSGQDSALLACKTCNENRIRNEAEIVKLKDDITVANRKIKELETEIVILKKRNSTIPPRGSDREKLERAQRQVDSLGIVVIVLRDELDNCKKNAIQNNAEVVKKAENDAKLLKRKNDSLAQVLILKNLDLDDCKKNSTITNTEIVRKAEADKKKAENDAKILKRKNDSLVQVLILNNVELDNCKKNSTTNNAEILRKAEADKKQAENDARVAKRQADSLAQVLIVKTIELDNCKKNSTMTDAEIVKKAQADKNKAENDAKVAKRQADSISQILIVKNTELENCKKNAVQYDAEVAKSKKCADENTMLKAEMTEMSKTISKLNTKNYALSYKVDSLINELKNCGKTGGTSTEDAELLRKCKETTVELNAEIERLKGIITARNVSLDSMKTIAGNLDKKQVELKAQIAQLNSDIEALKAKASSSNCDEIQKQLDDKNTENNKLKTDATALQNKINTLNNQLSELRTEYNFIVKQNQRCSQKLDSCLKGLNHTEPIDKEAPEKKDDGGSGSGGGPSMGNTDHSGQDPSSSQGSARNWQSSQNNRQGSTQGNTQPTETNGSGNINTRTPASTSSNTSTQGNQNRGSSGSNTGSGRR
jgi:hypothetical protein